MKLKSKLSEEMTQHILESINPFRLETNAFLGKWGTLKGDSQLNELGKS